ncbi:MAG: DUF6883 domain-containing protein [Planctomycetota bacterium]
MKLPFAHQVVIENSKIREYLLSPTHPIGRYKAAYFAVAGYGPGEWRRLGQDLRALAHTGDACEGQSSQYGRKYEVCGMLKCPNGRVIEVMSIWLVRKIGSKPRLITVFPGGKI